VAFELVAGLDDVRDHRLDAGAERVVLLAEPVKRAQVVGRLDDALVARRADVKLLVFVLRLEGVSLDRIRRSVTAVRPQVLLQPFEYAVVRAYETDHLRAQPFVLLDVFRHPCPRPRRPHASVVDLCLWLRTNLSEARKCRFRFVLLIALLCLIAS